MPRRKLKFTQGAYYHIYNRGAARAAIFHEAADYEAMLWTLKHYLPRLQLTLIAYCLMPNHYHWLVRQDGTLNAGLLPARVCKSYANRFNHKYQRSGTLVDHAFIATHFPGRHTYQRFVLDYLTGRDAMPQPLADYLAAL